MSERAHFLEMVRSMPLVSVDLVFVRDGREVLLGYRTNRPAQHSWFVPGGRIMKDERRLDALTRVARRELGIEDIHALQPGFLGPFEHFYPDCFAGETEGSTHYVVLGHRIDVPAGFEVQPADDQHTQLRWWDIQEALASPEVHRYSRDYLPLL
jgi:colanic acid biosynthesis protein WcaH